MSDVDPTPETPVTIGDRMGWFRGDIDAKFLALGLTLTSIDTSLQQIVLALRGATAPDDNILLALRGTTAANAGRNLWSSLNTTENNVNWTVAGEMNAVRHALFNSANLSAAEMIDHIASVLGAYPYGDLELASIRSFIWTIMQDLQRVGVDPDTNTGTGTQIGSTSTISQGGYRYIIWPAIEGVSRNTDGTQLTPNIDWSGYQVYIQTDAPTAILFDLTDSQLTNESLGTNTWISLGDSHILAFAVASMYNAKGFIRVPPQTDILYWSADDTEGVEVGGYGIRYMWNMTKYPGLSYVQSPPNPRVLNGTWDGYTWELTGSGLYCQYGTNGTGKNTSTNLTGVFPSDTHYILCQSLYPGLTIKLTPPS